MKGSRFPITQNPLGHSLSSRHRGAQRFTSGPTRFKPLLAAPEEYYEPADKQQEEGFTQEEVQSAAKRTLTFIIGEALGVDWEPALKQRLVEYVKERAAGEPKVLPASSTFYMAFCKKLAVSRQQQGNPPQGA
jgi:hypothetical protein